MSRPEFDGTELLIEVFSLNQAVHGGHGGFYVQNTVGLLNCQINVDRPPYGVVTSLLIAATGAFMFKTQWAC